MRQTWSKAKLIAHRFWRGLRDWCGDSAYERYLDYSLRADRETFLTPAQFYVDQLDRKYSRPNRCC